MRWVPAGMLSMRPPISRVLENKHGTATHVVAFEPGRIANDQNIPVEGDCGTK